MFAFIFLRLFLAVRAGTDRGAAMLKPVVNLSAGSQRSSLAGLEAQPEAALSLWLFIRSGVRAREEENLMPSWSKRSPWADSGGYTSNQLQKILVKIKIITNYWRMKAQRHVRSNNLIILLFFCPSTANLKSISNVRRCINQKT